MSGELCVKVGLTFRKIKKYDLFAVSFSPLLVGSSLTSKGFFYLYRLKDGEEISPSDTHTVLTKDGDTHRLEILATEQADAGVYTCKVTNRLGEVAESGTLNILRKILFMICFMKGCLNRKFSTKNVSIAKTFTHSNEV